MDKRKKTNGLPEGRTVHAENSSFERLMDHLLKPRMSLGANKGCYMILNIMPER